MYFFFVAAFSVAATMYGVYSLRKALRKTQLQRQLKKEKEKLDNEAKSFKKEAEMKRNRVPIYFGSQTGTAEGFAKETAKVLNSCGYLAQVIDLEDFDPEELATCKTALFYCATYGEGDPPDNAIDFDKWLTEENDDHFLKTTKFAVFGLGNTQYEHYNAMGKKIQKRLAELGGKCFYEYGEGDDDKDIEEDFEKWQDGLIDKMGRMIGRHTEAHKSGFTLEQVQEQSLYMYKKLPPPRRKDVLQTGGRYSARQFQNVDLKTVDFVSRHFYEAVPVPVVANKELRQSPGKDGLGSTLHVEFDISGTKVTYDTADNLAICPQNNPELVGDAAKYLQLDLDQWFALIPRKDGTGPLFPNPCTIRTALTHYVELNQVPSRHTLAELSVFAKSPEHQKRLAYLGSKEGNEDYHKKVVENRYDLVDIFEMFPSLNFADEPNADGNPAFNLAAFWEALPKLQARYYTISSSANAHKERIHVTASIVREPKAGIPEGRMFKGVCTNFLDRLRIAAEEAENDKKGKKPFIGAYVYVRSSTFKLPQEIERPIVLIGPGTGVAPMRAFVQERALQSPASRGDTILFFGCRRDNEDFIYKEEFIKACNDKVLTKLVTAFSRATEDKMYVQHMLKKNADDLWDYIDSQEASIYVCGGTQMGKDVQLAIEQIVAGKAKLTLQEAKGYIEVLQRDKRYIQELWSS